MYFDVFSKRAMSLIRPTMHCLIGFVLCLLLAACQTRPELTSPRAGWLSNAQAFAERQAWLEQQTAWKLRAKIAVKTPELREAANIVWHVQGDKNTLRLFGPLGVGAIRIEFDASGVILVDNKGREYRGNTAQQLLSDITGWPIPVDALAHWLFMVPAPETVFQYQLAPNSSSNDLKLTALEQQGWLISYDKHVQFEPEAPSMARKIVATKNLSTRDNTANETRQAEVRLILKSWVPQ